MNLLKNLILFFLIIFFNSCSVEDGTHKTFLWIVTSWQDVDRYNQNKDYWDKGNLYAPRYNLRGIASNNSSELIVVGQDGTIWQSSDYGLTWDNRTSGNGNTTNLWEVEYISGNYVAVGHSGIIITSIDGITWDNRTSGVTKKLRGIAYGNSKYVTVGSDGTVLTSSDSITWTQQSSPTTEDFFGLEYVNNKFIGVELRVKNFDIKPHKIIWIVGQYIKSNTLGREPFIRKKCLKKRMAISIFIHLSDWVFANRWLFKFYRWLHSTNTTSPILILCF